MDATFKVKELQRIAGRVIQVVPNRSPLDILRYFLVTVEGSKLTLFGTDQEIYIEASIEVGAVKGKEQFYIDAEKFHKVTSALPDDKPGKIKVSAEEVIVTAGKTRHKLKRLGIEPEVIDLSPLKKGVTIPGFGTMLKFFKPMIGTGDTDKSNVIAFIKDEVVMLPGPRGVWFTIEGAKFGRFFLSQKIAKVITGENITIAHSEEDAIAYIEDEDIKVWARTVDANRYPADNHVALPKGDTFSLVVNREDMKASQQRVLSVSMDRLSQKIITTFSEKKIEFRAGNEVDESMDEVKAETDLKEEFRSIIQGTFLLDMASSISQDEITLHIAGEGEPIVVKIPEEKEDEEIILPAYTYVIAALKYK